MLVALDAPLGHWFNSFHNRSVEIMNQERKAFTGLRLVDREIRQCCFDMISVHQCFSRCFLNSNITVHLQAFSERFAVEYE